jgi:hypothetical protein
MIYAGSASMTSSVCRLRLALSIVAESFIHGQFVRTGKKSHRALINNIFKWERRVNQYKYHDAAKERNTEMITVRPPPYERLGAKG